jgi:glycosyltransferase involved in cell wall biosynthesis
LVTVITVVLNRKEQILRTCESVSGQGVRDAEYMIIDGGSTDGTLEAVKHLESNLNVMTISEPDNGISDAFNKGIRLAKGELIGILNAGDWYEPDALPKLLLARNSNPDVDVFCGAIGLWEKGKDPLVCQSDPQHIEKETSLYHPSVFVRRSAYLKYGLYDESYRYAMDYELLLRFKRSGAKFLAIPDTLANMSLDGISSKHWYKGLLEVKRARSKYFSAANVAYYHARAVAMNFVARTLKKAGLSSIYRSYRSARDKHSMAGR